MTLTSTDRTMRVNDENARRAITVRKGQGGRGGGANDGKQSALPVFLLLLLPSDLTVNVQSCACERVAWRAVQLPKLKGVLWFSATLQFGEFVLGTITNFLIAPNSPLLGTHVFGLGNQVETLIRKATLTLFAGHRPIIFG